MRLKQLRKDMGYSQQKMAELLCITQQAYANYESGKREPGIETLKAMSDIFHVSVDYLLENNSENIKKEPPEVGSYDWFYKGLIKNGLIESDTDLSDSDILFIVNNAIFIAQQLQDYKKKMKKT